MVEPLYPALILIIFSTLVLGLILLLRMRRANYRLRSQLENAEAEMRSMNVEYNSSAPPRWEFALKQHSLGKVRIVSGVDVDFFSSCCLQTEAPLLPICHLNYFEITIVSLPSTTSVSLGLAPKDIIGVSVPGIAPDSVGLNFSTLEVLIGGTLKRNRFRCQSISAGDVIGCFFNPFQHHLYYTLNGRSQPNLAFKPSSQRLYPTLHANGPCTIKSNFGHASFVYPWANTYHYGLASSHPEDSAPPGYNQSSVQLPNYSETSNHFSFDPSLTNFSSRNSLVAPVNITIAYV